MRQEQQRLTVADMVAMEEYHRQQANNQDPVRLELDRLNKAMQAMEERIAELERKLAIAGINAD